MVDVNINWTVFFHILNFLILMLALNHFLYKPVRRILDERKAFFESLEHSADTAKLLIDEGEAKRDRHRSEVVAEGAALLAKFKDEARERERVILEKTHLDANNRLEEARSRLGSEVEEARAQLRQDAQVLAQSLVERILGREPGPAH
jgi:F-type H+-transporting ATPase subunit b